MTLERLGGWYGREQPPDTGVRTGLTERHRPIGHIDRLTYPRLDFENTDT